MTSCLFLGSSSRDCEYHNPHQHTSRYKFEPRAYDKIDHTTRRRRYSPPDESTGSDLDVVRPEYRVHREERLDGAGSVIAKTSELPI